MAKRGFVWGGGGGLSFIHLILALKYVFFSVSASVCLAFAVTNVLFESNNYAIRFPRKLLIGWFHSLMYYPRNSVD